jgi:hypothetical protein
MDHRASITTNVEGPPSRSDLASFLEVTGVRVAGIVDQHLETAESVDRRTHLLLQRPSGR